MRIKKQTNPYSKQIVGIDVHGYHNYLHGKIQLSELKTLITTNEMRDGIYETTIGYCMIVPDDTGDGFSLHEYDTVEDTIKPDSALYVCAVGYLVQNEDFTNEEKSRYADLMVHLNNLYPGVFSMCTKISDTGATFEKKMHYEMIGLAYAGEICPICSLEDYRSRFKQYLES